MSPAPNWWSTAAGPRSDVSDEKKPAVAPWHVIESKDTYRDEWLALRSDTVRLPNGRILSPFHVVELPNWVNVIALTRDRNVLLIEEYRHGARQTVLELPSGVINGTNEPPAAAIKRELLEETGFASEDWHDLGSFFANPARQTNRVHSFAALDAHKVSEPSPDEGEVLLTHEMPWRDFLAELEAGRLELQGFHLAALWMLRGYIARSANPRLAALLA